MSSVEQQARELLGRMEIDGDQFTAGELGELAHVISLLSGLIDALEFYDGDQPRLAWDVEKMRALWPMVQEIRRSTPPRTEQPESHQIDRDGPGDSNQRPPSGRQEGDD